MISKFNLYRFLLAALSSVFIMTATAQNQTQDGVIVDIETSLGNIRALLYNDTPLHRDNFLKLVESGFYDGVLFHRVIDGFMVQTGDADSKDAQPGQQLGASDPGYTIEAEIQYPKHFHKYGALAAARTADAVNPERRSSGSQFYIVTGKKYNPMVLSQMEQRQCDSRRQRKFNELAGQHRAEIEALIAAKDEAALDSLKMQLIKETEDSVICAPMPEEIKEAYTNIGGTPHLDGEYTVFGEVLSGMDVVEKIQKAETDPGDRPREDIRIISIKVEK